MDFGLKFIRRLKPCKWRYRPPLDDGVEHFGLVAQDVEKIASPDYYAFVVLLDNGKYALNMTEFIGPLIKSVQELSDKVSRLEDIIDNP